MCKRLLVLIPFVLMLALSTSAQAQPTGQILIEYWNNMGGTNLENNFYNTPRFPDDPDDYEILTLFDKPYSPAYGDNYAAQIRGYLYPPGTGDYTFWMACDDDGDLFLSTDDNPANKVKIAEINGWCPAYDFDNTGGTDNPNQVSAPIALEAGKKYYIEAAYKEGGGGDGFAAAWQGPGIPDRVIIDGAYLSPAALTTSLLKASSPIPGDGAVDVDVSALEWTAGAGAVSHRVYLSSDATIDDADLLGETNLTIQVAILDLGATYYWRVDEIDADGNVIEGNVWTFTTIPMEAHFPSIADGATNVISAVLSWAPGKNAIMHDVYFGTDQAAIAAANMSTFKGKLFTTTFDPGALAEQTTYYWRVDEFSPAGTTAGPVWSFSTVGPVPSAGIPDLVAYYPLQEDASSLAALDHSGNNNHGALKGGGPTFGPDPERGQVLILPGGSNQFVDCGSVGISGTMPRTIMCWAKADHTNIPNWTLIFGFTGNATGGGGNGSHFNIGSLGGPGGVGAHVWGWEETIFSDQEALEWRHYAMTYDGTTIRYYGDGMPMDTDVAKSNVRDLSASADRVHIGSRITQDSSFPGRVSEARIYNRVLTDEEIRQLGADLSLPYDPEPADGASDVPASTALAWGPGEGAVQQDVYLGTDADAVAAADATDTTGIYRGRQAETTYAPADLSYGTTHYWRVDQVDADGNIVAGPVWSFSVAAFVPMDNWAAKAKAAGAVYLDTFVKDGLYDIGTYGGEQTYEFVVLSDPDETQASMALIGRRQFGDTRVGLKYEQWNNTGTYGATVFGVVDLDFGVANNPGVVTHLVFVSSETTNTTDLYVDGVFAGSVTSAISLSGPVGIGYGAQGADMTGVFDDFDGDIFGVAIYDAALTAEEIASNAFVFTSGMADVTAPGDTIKGVPDDGDWPGNEHPALAIDDNSGTKYLHFKGGTMATGIRVAPSMGLTVVNGLALTTANDDYGRDPISFELSGSNDSIDGPYTLIAAGDVVDFAQATLWPRFTRNATGIFFANDVPYKFYQVVFPTVRSTSSTIMQIAEIELLGVVAFENLAFNGGLEDDLTGAGWNTYGNASMEVVHELVGAAIPDVPVEGEHSLHVTVNAAGANFWDAGLQHGGKVFEAGKSYTLSVWFKSKAGPFQINIKPERAASPWEGYGSQAVTITEEWAQYTVNTGVMAATVDPASLTFHIAYAPGEFYADDLWFYEDK